MNIPSRRILALPAMALALLALPVHADPVPTQAADTAAAQRERAERAAFQARQKALAEERGVAVAPAATSPATIVDVPQDETDSPGSVKP